ncbi:MAG: 3-dehydroquinate dehydratase [Candidatus Izemoplasmatales bacterium]|jgi:3-dehydroquinate dehydratase-2|nr:3-dehydroquinate dehydratase [Candidatus Izemoplasmatales bacterium]
MNILVINGPNLNVLGVREPEIYGKESYSDLVNFILDYGASNHLYIEVYQTNHEGEIIDILQEKMDAFHRLVINPGAFTHYSYAIYDAIKGCSYDAVEVHISDINKREPFRQISVIKDACIAQISGKGFNGYIEAIDILRKGK